MSTDSASISKGSLTRYAGFGISEKAMLQSKPCSDSHLTALFLLAAAALPDQQPPAAQPTAPQSSTPSPEGKPQVKVNYLNVCTPGTDEETIIKGALAAVQPKPAFSADFEFPADALH